MRGFDDRAEALLEARDELIAAIRWECERFLKCAQEIAAEHDEDKANLVLDRYAEYLREQAIR